MSNYEIARIFTRIADLMEVQGENAFKVRAYRKAADTIEGLPELLNIPGLGTRKVHQLYTELGISSLDELERAAREHRLRDVAGFGAKTEENLLHGIESYRRR